MSNRRSTVTGLFIAPARRAPMVSLTEVRAIVDRGLEGDRYASGAGSYNDGAVGKRQVTFFNGNFLHGSLFRPIDTRRNIIVEGDVELMYLIGKEFDVGGVRLRGVKYCDPCRVPRSIMDEAAVFKDYFQERGGLIADVVIGGILHLGDTLISPQVDYD